LWDLRCYYGRRIFSEGLGHVRNDPPPAAHNI
jgi:hypothetical protein